MIGKVADLCLENTKTFLCETNLDNGTLVHFFTP